MLSVTYEPVVAPTTRLPRASATSHAYRGGPRGGGRSGRLVMAALISAGLHAALLWGHFLFPAKPIARVAVAEPIEVVQIEMPVLEPEIEPAEVQEAFGEETVEMVAPPTLADIPTVTVSVFTQPIVPSPQTVNLGAGARIPIGRPGNPLGKGMGLVFDVANIDQPPVVRSHVPPDYPLEMRRNGTRGTVTVEFVVDKQGSVVAVQVIASSHTAFEAPAVAAVQKWKFRPGKMSGRTVNTRVRQLINFNLETD